MTAFLIAFGAILALVLAWNLLIAAGWPAWLGLLVAVATVGGDPTEPLRALAFGATAFVAGSFLRRAA